ncbi:hypothetical protein LZ198_17690 [Myxococcus sp. K15C18031901]|uniref:hypothetical protein n=1 Tax=Myxococcus dinghuensis TaxID=2906761 RepID=UPI0020A7EEDD|nr:hypothetical protein [Myxococcus dinghuensis]MCP3100706.1 hypothetical protein [Myxococcus dinghuensis]
MRNAVVVSVLVSVLWTQGGCGEEPPIPAPPGFCPERPPAQSPFQPPTSPVSLPWPGVLASRATPSLAQEDLGPDGRRWWAEPCVMGTPGLTPNAPWVAMEDAGHALALWSESDGRDERLWFSVLEPDTGWTPAEALGLFRRSPQAPLTARQPQVVLDASGRALAVWMQSEGTSPVELWASRFTPGEGWLKPDPVMAVPLGEPTAFQLAIDMGGNATLTWSQFDGDTFSENIWAARLEGDEGWGEARRIDTPVPGFSLEPRLSLGQDGHAVVAWYRLDEFEGLLGAWVARWTPEDGWLAAEQVNAAGVEGYNTEAVAGPQGSVLAVWSEIASVQVELWARRFTPGTGWGTPERLETALGTTSAGRATPERNGRTLVVWPRFDGTRVRLSSRAYDFAQGWREGYGDFGVQSEGNAREPWLANGPQGQFIAVWAQELASDRQRIFTSRYAPGQGWGRAVKLDETSIPLTGTPRLSVGEDGAAVATWLHGGEAPGIGVSVLQ